MRKFKFGLQKVMDVKEKLMKKFQRDLAYMEGMKADAEKKLLDLQHDYEKYYLELNEDAGRTISEIRIKYSHYYQLLEMIEMQKKQITEIEGKIGEIRHRLLEEQRNHKILGKLKEKYYSKFLDSIKREEQINLDEIAIMGNRDTDKLS